MKKRNAISWAAAGREWKLYLFILPSLLLIAGFAYLPAFSAVYHSFFEWSGGLEKRFIGLNNFSRAFQDPVFRASFITIAILVVANMIKLIPSILVAVLIHRLESERWQYWYRILVVTPMVIPMLVVLFVWKSFFDPNTGALNLFLEATGGLRLLRWIDTAAGWGVFVEGQMPVWLGQPELVIPSLILWGFPWIGAVGVLVYLAGLQSIGKEVYESSDLDGANGFQKFFYIELPLILTQVRITLAMLIIGTLQGFGFQLLLLGENGGPEGRGMVPGLWMYNRAFYEGQFGYACALGLILFAVILLLIFLSNKYVRVDK